MNEKETVNLAQAVKAILDNFTAHAESIKLQAKLVRTKYNSLLEQGFSKEDALALCTRI